MCLRQKLGFALRISANYFETLELDFISLDLGLEMTTDVGNRVLKYVDENLLDVKVKDLSGEVGAKVKDLIDSGSSKVSGLLGRFMKRK